MKTEKQLLKRYREMMVSLSELNSFVKEPPEYAGFGTITRKVDEFNTQSDLCALMCWVLDISEPHTTGDIDKLISLT